MLFITVPLKGVKPQKVDLFSTEEYLKVHYPPYLFECFLFAPVYDRKSAAEIGNGVVLFKLEKQEPQIWEQLHNPDAEGRERQRELREAAVLRSQERAKEEQEEKASKKQELNRFGVQQQMDLEDVERKRIESVKEMERTQATEELERWKDQQKLMAEKEKQEAEERKRKEALMETEKKAQKQKEKLRKKKNIFHEETKGKPMREPGRISVTFTPRVFPTPVRESQTAQEEEWLKKQADMRKIIQVADEDLSEEEKNPVWLRDKGNEFFKAGNCKAACNAYSHAIRLNCRMPSYPFMVIYSNRAACHLKMENHMKCIEDSSKALELLKPPVPQNAASRCKAHVRRGTSLAQLELYVEGLQDYEAALKIDPTNDQLLTDANRIRAIIQGSAPS
ncbi:Dynein assembly factor 4, axonemal [Lamellibrachia satsuma]|nr:Dynein assembly factor 4, axonemal [Lamellibrachia satsuma]